MQTIGIIGTGIFGTALAITSARAGNSVLCWDRKTDIPQTINTKHINPHYLSQISLPSQVKGTQNIAEIFSFSDTILLTTSAQASREILQKIKPYIRKETIIVFCAKGLEASSGKMLSEIAKEEIPDTKIAILSGPGFAADIAQNKLTSVTIACSDKKIASILAQKIGTNTFRPYISQDIISPQIGGSIKNVIAIAAGIIDGAKLGEGAKAALVTRGLAEMMRLSQKMGGNTATMMGMCGIGDLVLTANSPQSRNYSLGHAIGFAGSAQQPLKDNVQTVEGIYTTQAVVKLAQKYQIEMPICQTVFKILFENMSISSAIEELMTRPYKEEGF